MDPFEIIRQVWSTTCQSPTQKLVLAALGSYADKEWSCYPSIASLCSRTGLAERTVQYQIRSLALAGIITIEDRSAKHQSNVYRIQKGAIGAPVHVVHPVQATTPKGASDGRNGCTTCTPTTSNSQELPKGNGKAPKKFISELNAQIRIATDEIQRLRDGGNEFDRPRLRELIEKRRQWKSELLSQ